mgnify:CR=1 FL=1
MVMWQFWLIAAGIFFIIEIATVGFLVFWFGIGALIAMVVSIFVPNVYIQAIVFIVSSTLLIFFTKPFVNKFVNKGKTIATNAYSIIGRTGIVTKEINDLKGTGQVKIGGETWSAKTLSEETLPENTEIEVVKIDGVKAIVQKVSKLVEKV